MSGVEDIWVLVDFRPGTAIQGIALAEATSLPFSIKRIEYNALAGLPNVMLGTSCSHITKGSKDSLITDHPPRVVISSGRRTATVAAYLKRIYPDVKIVQIMRPDLNIDIFDLLVLPQHDTFNANQDSKCHVIRTIGSLNNVQARIEKHQNDVTKYTSMKSFIGVLIGGDTKEYKFSKSDALELCSALEEATSYSGMPAFISFSRRTPEHLKSMLVQAFGPPNVIYDPTNQSNTLENPYIEILKNAKFLVITCDSVSMCSEAASTGKPVYIYCPPKFSSKKHKYLMQQLIDLGIAKPFNSGANFAEEYHYTPLNEVAKVSHYMLGSMGL